MIQLRGDCWDDPWGNGDPIYPFPEEDPVWNGGIPASPKPPDRPGGHYEQIGNGWVWVPDPSGPSGPEPGTTKLEGDTAYVWNGSEWVLYDQNSGYRGGSPNGYVPNRNVGGGEAPRTGGGGSLPSFSFNPGPAPMFDAPTFNRRADFVAPGWEDVLKDPGYQFRKDQGMGALAAKYASLGNLNTGGAKKGFIDYAEGLASQEYANVYNRALGTYKTNFQGDLDAYDRLFQEKESEYKPKLIEWQTLAQLGQRGAELNFNRDWDLYSFGIDDEFRRKQANDDLLARIIAAGAS